MVSHTIRICNEFIFLRGREVVSVVPPRNVDRALCSQSACGLPAEADQRMITACEWLRWGEEL